MLRALRVRHRRLYLRIIRAEVKILLARGLGIPRFLVGGCSAIDRLEPTILLLFYAFIAALHLRVKKELVSLRLLHEITRKQSGKVLLRLPVGLLNRTNKWSGPRNLRMHTSCVHLPCISERRLYHRIIRAKRDLLLRNKVIRQEPAARLLAHAFIARRVALVEEELVSL